MNLRRVFVPLAALLLSPLGFPGLARAQEPIDVWLDVDPANGIGEVDDGLAMVQTFHSPELRVLGVSTVFGNAELRYATPLAVNITRTFGPEGLTVAPGAASGEAFGEVTDAVEAMAAALERGPMTILALGPLTNVGTLVAHRPDLVDRIEEVVVVAGRRPGQAFVSVEGQPRPFSDFNFERDAAAAQALMDSGVRIVFAPWEVSSHVWITRGDLEALKARGGSGLWVYSVTQHWIDGWERRLGAPGFNPFDTLAVGYLTHPETIEGFACTAEIVRVEEADAREGEGEGETPAKPHWIVTEDPEGPYLYLHTPAPAFKGVLLERLGPR